MIKIKTYHLLLMMGTGNKGGRRFKILFKKPLLFVLLSEIQDYGNRFSKKLAQIRAQPVNVISTNVF